MTAAASFDLATLDRPASGVSNALAVLRIEPGASGGVELAYLASLRSDASRRTMATGLAVLAELVSAGTTRDPDAVPWHGLSNAHVQALASALAERYRPSSANTRLAALRGVLKAAWRAGRMADADYHRAVDVRPIAGSREPAGRALEPAELAALFAACAEAGGEVGARDAAALALLVGAGLRRNEAATLDLEGLDLAAGSVRVLGKGNRERTVPLPGGAVAALRAWLEIRGEAPGPLLWAASGGGKLIAGRAVTGDGLLRLCQRLAKRAHVPTFRPHDCRRSYASGLLDAGADLAAVQGLLGHASPATTVKYDRRGERARRKAAELLLVPYQRPR